MSNVWIYGRCAVCKGRERVHAGKVTKHTPRGQWSSCGGVGTAPVAGSVKKELADKIASNRSYLAGRPATYAKMRETVEQEIAARIEQDARTAAEVAEMDRILARMTKRGAK